MIKKIQFILLTLMILSVNSYAIVGATKGSLSQKRGRRKVERV